MVPSAQQALAQLMLMLVLAQTIKCLLGTSLVVQWVRLRTSNAGGPGSIPGQGTRSHMHAATKEPTCPS